MRRSASLSLLALMACQEASPPPALPTVATDATSDEASTTATAGASAAGSNAVVVVRRDPWSRLIDRLGDLDDGARGAAVKTLLEKRGRERKQED